MGNVGDMYVCVLCCVCAYLCVRACVCVYLHFYVQWLSKLRLWYWFLVPMTYFHVYANTEMVSWLWLALQIGTQTVRDGISLFVSLSPFRVVVIFFLHSCVFCATREYSWFILFADWFYCKIRTEGETMWRKGAFVLCVCVCTCVCVCVCVQVYIYVCVYSW